VFVCNALQDSLEKDVKEEGEEVEASFVNIAIDAADSRRRLMSCFNALKSLF
jgi:hypothetical protein